MPQFNRSSFSLYVRSAVYAAGQTLSTLVIGPLMVLATPLSFRWRYRLANGWVRFNLWVLGQVCGLRHEVEGLENLPERSGVILCKHQSAWETLALQVIFPPLCFILKKELLNIPVWGWAMATQEPIAIDRTARTAAIKQVLREGVDRLQKGRWVVIFPEGTRMPPGTRGQYNASGAALAQRAGCPVIPVAHNAGEYWGKNGFLKYPGTIRVCIGPAIEAGVEPPVVVMQRVEAWIEARMEDMARLPRPVDTYPGD